MTFGLTDDGFILKTFEDIRTEVEAYQRLNIASDLDLQDDSVLGQMNIPHFNEDAQLWEVAQALFAAMDPDAATAWNLDQVASITGTLREKYSKTTVTAQVTLNPNKALPAGSTANLTNKPNTQFISLTEVPADPSGGTFDVVFEAKVAGATLVLPGMLSEISIAVSGWTAVSNSAQGATGTQPEDDVLLRLKRDLDLLVTGSTTLDAIIADVSRVVSANVIGFENDTAYTDLSTGIPAHSFEIVVSSGDADEIAGAIFQTKAGGIKSFGSSAGTAIDNEGVSHTVSFSFAEEKVFYCTTTIVTTSGWDVVNGPTLIKAAIAAYVNGLAIGQDVIYDRVKSAIYSVSGVYKVSACTIKFAGGSYGTIDLSVGTKQFATSDVANITVI